LKIIYRGRHGYRSNSLPSEPGDVIELLYNNWDDYGHVTSFPTSTRINGIEVELSSIKVLVAGQTNTAAYLQTLLNAGWDGVFPIPDTNYVSVSAEIEFYEQLIGLLGRDGALTVAHTLRDASVMSHIEGDPVARGLTETEGFTLSLQRERGAIKAFADVWKLFTEQAVEVMNVDFRFRDVFDQISTLRLKFQTDSPLPHDINVLIGPNGVGKSRILLSLVEDWISPSVTGDVGFTTSPSFSQIVVVSYSPFEDFPIDLVGQALREGDVYRYFGFRGRGEPIPRDEPDGVDQPGEIELSHDFPKVNAALSLIECVADDIRYGDIEGWPGKIRTAEAVLKTAIDFDAVTVAIAPGTNLFELSGLFNAQALLGPLKGDDGEDYLPLNLAGASSVNLDRLHRAVIAQRGVTFFRNGRQVHLSSGQRLFAYIVINILGAIKRNSLILVDEPELFLHPTLEIQFVEMLKAILARLNSKALLATHSVVTVREMPSDCVHVLERTDEGLVMKQPPFQTFAGDIQRIASYVFGDRFKSKPHEAWIRDRLAVLGSADALLAELGDDLNEELVIRIRAMDAGRW